MKKIFTLISVAFVAMSVNAQTEVWSVDAKLTFNEQTKVCDQAQAVDCTNDNFFKVTPESKGGKTYPAETYASGAAAVVPSDGTPLTLKSYIIDATAGPVSMHAVSTPNDDASENEGWQLGGGGNNALNTDSCDVKFEKYVKPKNGNPSMSYKGFYEYNSNNDETYRVYEDLWTPELNAMPNKGLYYEFTSTEAGKLNLALIVWRPGNKLYFFEKSTFTQFPTSKLSIKGYVNNNTVVWGSNENAFSTINMTDNHDYQVPSIPGKQILGYMSLDIEANKTYVLLCSNSQPGIYGFWLTSPVSGIESINATKADNPNAPIYNLAGQQVTKSYKGVVIQNGNKFVQK